MSAWPGSASWLPALLLLLFHSCGDGVPSDEYSSVSEIALNATQTYGKMMPCLHPIQRPYSASRSRTVRDSRSANSSVKREGLPGPSRNFSRTRLQTGRTNSLLRIIGRALKLIATIASKELRELRARPNVSLRRKNRNYSFVAKSVTKPEYPICDEIEHLRYSQKS